MKKFIQNFTPYLSEHKLTQEKAIDWLSSYNTSVDKDFFDRYAVKSDYIESRHVYSKGIGDLPFSGEALYSKNEESNPSIDKRSKHAQEKMEEILKSLYENESEAPDHINHVTCTHYQSPSAAQKIVVEKNFFNETEVTHLYHMGCYASLPAVRVSKSYIAQGASKVDVVHTELCSFHLNKETSSAGQIIMDTLFSDGAIKYSVTSEDYFLKSKASGFEVITQKEVLMPGSENEMTWKLGKNGFVMTLTRNVPLILANQIEKYMVEMFSDAGLNFETDKDKVIFAVHPGGPKIIELVEQVLRLSNEQVKHSKFILKNRGNMSSATIPHIWNEILNDNELKSGTHVATVAFGPGLTITGAILRLCKN